MLIVTRRKDEGIIIGNISIRILKIENQRVKLGISAPPEIQIFRDELLEREKE